MPPLAFELFVYGQPESVRRRAVQIVEEDISRQRLERLSLLARHYKVAWGNEGCEYILLLRLAEDFIEGFRVELSNQPKVGAVGRPRGSQKIGGFELVKEIDIITFQTKGTVSDACKALSRRKGKWFGSRPSSLETRYYEWCRMTKAILAKKDPVVDKIIELCSSKPRQ